MKTPDILNEFGIANGYIDPPTLAQLRTEFAETYERLKAATDIGARCDAWSRLRMLRDAIAQKEGGL